MFRALLAILFTMTQVSAAPVIVGGSEGAQFNAPLIWKSVTEPSSPASGFNKVWISSVDGKMYRKTSTGAVIELGDSTSLQGFSVADTTPTSNQVLTWNSSNSEWEPRDPQSTYDPSASPSIIPEDGSQTLGNETTKWGYLYVGQIKDHNDGDGTSGQVLGKDGDGNLLWMTPSGDAVSIQGVGVASATPTTGDILTYNNTSGEWEPGPAPVSIGLPGSSTDNGVVLWDGTSGDAVKDSSVTISGTTITGDLAGNASTATALAANPSDCSTNQFANAIAANGNLTCAQPAFTDIAGVATIAQGGTNNGSLPVTNGTMYYGDGTKLVGLAPGSAGQVIKFDGSIPGWSTVSDDVLNFIPNPRFTYNADGWSTYADAAGTAPVDGTGGSPTVTFTRNTSSPIFYPTDPADGLLTKDGSNRQGEGVCTDLIIPSGYYTSASTQHYIRFPYKTGGSYASDDVRVYVIPSGGTPELVKQGGQYDGIIASSAMSTFTGVFNTISGTSDYKLCFHVASTNASAYTLQVARVLATPQTTQPGYFGDGFKEYTATLSSSTNVSASKFFWRREGDSMRIKGMVRWNGNGGGGTFTVSLPSGYTMDTSRLPGGSGGLGTGGAALGHGHWRDVTAGDFMVTVAYESTTTFSFTEHNSTTNQIAGTEFANNDALDFDVLVPISGWQASAALTTNEILLQNPAKAPISATSAAKTPSSSGQWQAHSGNSLTLTPGTWTLTGAAHFANNGSDPGYTATQLLWAAGNGADSGTTPTALSSVVSVESANFLNPVWVGSSTLQITMNAPEITVKCLSATCTVYLNTLANLNTPTNGRITVYANAKREADFSVFSHMGDGRVEDFHMLTACSGTGTNCSLTRKSRGVVGVVSDNTFAGAYVATFSPPFKSAPTCICTAASTSEVKICPVTANTTSTVSFSIYKRSDGSIVADGFSVICRGEP